MKVQTYSSIARIFHWVSAALMFAVVSIAWYMGVLARNDPSKGTWITVHKSIGITILFLTLLRIAHRMTNRAPDLPNGFSSLERLAAHSAHFLLYFTLFAMPLTGYLMSDLGGHPFNWFGLFQVPQLLTVDKASSSFFHNLHKIGQWVVYTVVTIHLLAVIKHVRNGDGIFERMWPNRPGHSQNR